MSGQNHAMSRGCNGMGEHRGDSKDLAKGSALGNQMIEQVGRQPSQFHLGILNGIGFASDALAVIIE